MSFLMPKTPSVPAMPKPIKPPPAPTTDQAQIAADAELTTNKRRGAMANIFSPTDTGTQLSQPAQESSLKRVLG